MAQQIKQLTIQAPGFFGINTQDSPVGINPNFASVADNCAVSYTHLRANETKANIVIRVELEKK